MCKKVLQEKSIRQPFLAKGGRFHTGYSLKNIREKEPSESAYLARLRRWFFHPIIPILQSPGKLL